MVIVGESGNSGSAQVNTNPANAPAAAGIAQQQQQQTNQQQQQQVNTNPQGYGQAGSNYSQGMANSQGGASDLGQTRQHDLGNGMYQWQRMDSVSGQWTNMGQPIAYQLTPSGANAYVPPSASPVSSVQTVQPSNGA